MSLFSRTSLATGTAFALALGAPTAAYAQATYSFNLPAQDLGRSLRTVARRTGANIVFEPSSVRGRQAPALSGSFSAAQAIERLLAGSGLGARQTSGGSWVVAPSPGESRAGGAAADIVSVESPEIVVTGTNIRGAAPAANGFAINREQIQRSGFTTVEQLVESVPQNFGGGQTGSGEDGRIGPGSQASANVEGATGVNLRGLGTTSTLVLINGQRVAPANFGSVVDVSLIPVGAIERVEFLTDGASAVYGSDAIAGVVNFITRRGYNGVEGRVSYGAVTDGSLDEYLASTSAGFSWGSGGAVATVQYRHRDSLPSTERSFSQSARQPTDLLPETDTFSVFASANQDLTERLDISAQALISRRTSARFFTSATRTDFTQAETNQLNASVTGGLDLGADWRAELNIAHSVSNSEDPTFSTPPLAGTTNGLPRGIRNSSIDSVEAKGSGTLFQIPGGNIRIAFGGFYRREHYDSLVVSTNRASQADRNVRGAFGEVNIPLFSSANPARLMRRLVLTGALRLDDYSDFGSAVNSRAGIEWSPMSGLNFAASYNTSFRAPSAIERTFGGGIENILNFRFVSPTGGTTPVFLLTGTKPLQPEHARSLFISTDIRPQFLPSFRARISFYDIDFRDRIITPPFDTSALLKPEIYASLITPLANDAQAQAFLDRLISEGAVYFNTLGTGAAGVRNVVDTRQQNVARSRVSGFDINASYGFNIGTNRLEAEANAALIRHIRTQFTTTSVATDISDQYGSPLDLRIRGGISFQSSDLSVSVFANYAGSYRDTSAIPAGRASAWLTADLNLRYRPAFARRLQFSLTVLNVFDVDPPFVQGGGATGIHYDTGNATPLGRFVSLSAGFTW